jgi:hypothetical protein
LAERWAALMRRPYDAAQSIIDAILSVTPGLLTHRNAMTYLCPTRVVARRTFDAARRAVDATHSVRQRWPITVLAVRQVTGGGVLKSRNKSNDHSGAERNARQ